MLLFFWYPSFDDIEKLAVLLIFLFHQVLLQFSKYGIALFMRSRLGKLGHDPLENPECLIDKPADL